MPLSQHPLLHVYETFLADHDPQLRAARGVYDTPQPVVSYIVRSVDALLKSRFGFGGGLSHPVPCAASLHKGDPSPSSPPFLIVDPACGTGAFLYAVVDHIRRQVMHADSAAWPAFVRDHLLPRLVGFELLPTPLALARYLLEAQLSGRDLASSPFCTEARCTEEGSILPSPSGRGAGGEGLAEGQGLRAEGQNSGSWPLALSPWRDGPLDFSAGDRLNLFLANTLDALEQQAEQLFHFDNAPVDKSDPARLEQRFTPLMVVLGNPPYRGISSNSGGWIEGLLKGRLPDGSAVASYYEVDGQPLNERKLWLQDDYVKFLRWGQWQVERAGAGILAFVTNHGYLDNPTFRGMRQALMQAFDEIYLLDLHGNAKKRETAPDGTPDENVFDIQQGVAIGIFVRLQRRHPCPKVFHTDLWNSRVQKFQWLESHGVDSTEWRALSPTFPYYFFVPFDDAGPSEYDAGWRLPDIFPLNSTGIVTARDDMVVDFDREPMLQRIADLRGDALSDGKIRERYFAGKGSPKYPPGDTRGWKLSAAREALRADGLWEERVVPCCYRLFDTRRLYYTPSMVDWPRLEVMRQFDGGKNLGLISVRQQSQHGEPWSHAFVCTDVVESCVISNKTREINYVFPLYRIGERGRVPNIAPAFVVALGRALKLTLLAEGRGDLKQTFGPEDIFHYVYAALHSPAYRQRYAQRLRVDFPRIALPADREQFARLCGLGRELVDVHLLKPAAVDETATRFPVPGDNLVQKGHPKYLAPGAPDPLDGRPLEQGRVYLSSDSTKHKRRGQYVEGVPPEAWQFRVGCYRVLEKWLKARRGRRLSDDDVRHYRQIASAVIETLRLMSEIDANCRKV